MKTRKSKDDQKKRKRSASPTLDDTVIDDILKDIDRYYKPKSTEVINSKSELEEATNTEPKRPKRLKNSEQHSTSPKKSNNTKTKLIDTGNFISLNKQGLQDALTLLSESSKPEKKQKAQKAHLKFSRTCNEGYDDMLDLINWQSYAYAVRVIRNLILNREWEHLKELLRIMLMQPRVLKNYVKELTYLYFMINADTMDAAAVEDYFLLCFSTYDKSRKPLREFDIWFRNSEM